VKVKVLEVDVKRNRIALTLRLDDAAAPRPAAGASSDRRPADRGARPGPRAQPTQSTAMAAAFAKLRK
jgi:uncharacterized protein